MSATEILRKPETLRKMLDERGVEHYDRFDVTEWVGADGEICHTSVTHSNGATVLVLRKCTTPTQAIAATLGPKVCHMKETVYPFSDKDEHWMVCSECGFSIYMRRGWQPLRYCSHCGARVMEATS